MGHNERRMRYGLIRAKLELFRHLSTDELKSSLAPGQRGSPKIRPDGIVLDGHHRISVPFDRGGDVHQLPREITKEEP